MYIATFWGIFLSFQKTPDFFVVFGICTANLWIFREKTLLALSKLHSTLLKNHLWWKKNCWKNCNLNTFVVREFFSYFWGQNYARLAKISLYILDERFGEKQLCWESAQTFHHFRNSSKRFSEFWREFFWPGGHNWILRVQMKIFFEGLNWKRDLLLRIKLHCFPFGNLREKDSPYFCGMVKAGLSKLRYTCSDEHFDKNFFWKSHQIFIISGISAKISQNFDKKTFGSVVTFAFCVPRWTFSLIFERGKWRKTCLFFWKFRIVIIFRLWAKKISNTFAGMVTASLSEIRCTCSDEVFYQKIFQKAQ